MSLPSNPPPHAAWLVLPEINRAIDGTLRRRGIRGADLEDQRQTVLRMALEIQQPPGSVGECVRLVQTIAQRCAIGMFRKVRRRAKFDAGLCEDPDEFAGLGPASDARDAIDARREIDLVRHDIASGNITQRQATILEKAIDDVPQTEIAAQMNLAHQTVRNELSIARRTARLSWAAYAAAALLALGLLVWQLDRPNRVAHPPPRDIVSPPHDTPRSPTPQLRAEALRRKALHECDMQRWDACLDELDQARALDPEGDDASIVQKARQDATKRIRDRGAAPPKTHPN